MCGILCCLGCSSSDLDKQRRDIIALSKKIRHRGPDWSGYCVQENGTTANLLCHERLGIVDPAGGEQPLLAKKPDGRTIACAVNGEIYNHKSLRQGELAGTPFRTESDCEVIPWLWDGSADGEFINKLDGIFAFVCTDSSTGRDHLGIESLYIGTPSTDIAAWEGETVWIASEMKAFPSSIDRLEEFPPGSYMTSHDRVFKRWFHPAWINRDLIPTEKHSLEKIRVTFERAVTKMLMSDVPYGVLLSGGLDSSLVAACAARHAAMDEKTQAWWPRLHSFCIGLPDSPDIVAAEKVAKFLGTAHHSFTEVIYHLETYDLTTVRASTPMYLLCRKIKSMGIKMVLSGEGSDEAFGGYLYFHKAPNKVAFHQETVDKLMLLSKYDNLRANKSTLAWGVEARVPFLDPDFLSVVMSLDPEMKMITKERPMEKHILRAAFDVEPAYLPKDVLWRQKEQFSDGVGYSWIDQLKITDEQMAEAHARFPFNTPLTKEHYYYRDIFESHFPSDAAAKLTPGGFTIACSTPAALAWEQSWASMKGDPSGRAVNVHSMATSK